MWELRDKQVAVLLLFLAPWGIAAQQPPMLAGEAMTPGPSILARKIDYLMEVCREVPSEGALTTAMNTVDPIGMLAVELGNRSGGDILRSRVMATIKPMILQVTAHGKLIRNMTGAGTEYFIYHPEPGYVGEDRAVFAAEFEGKLYKIVVDLRVSKRVDEKSPGCPESRLIHLR